MPFSKRVGMFWYGSEMRKCFVCGSFAQIRRMERLAKLLWCHSDKMDCDRTIKLRNAEATWQAKIRQTNANNNSRLANSQ